MQRFTTREFTSQEDQDAWTALWQRSARVGGLHWNAVEGAAKGVGRPVRVGVLAPDGQLSAGFVFVERRVRTVTAWLNPAPFPFTGILAARDAPSADQEILAAMSALAKSAVSHAEVIFHPAEKDVRALLWDGWQARPYYNFLSAITGQGVLRTQAENSVRRQADKAAKGGFQFRSDIADAEAVISLWEDMRRRKGVPAHVHADCYRALLSSFTGSRDEAMTAVVASVVDADGAVDAGGIYLRDGERVQYLLGASRASENESGTGAPSLLHLAAADAFHERWGDYLYDWVGANTPSVVQFKKKFRPRLELCLRATFSRGLAKLWR